MLENDRRYHFALESLHREREPQRHARNREGFLTSIENEILRNRLPVA